MTQDQDEDQDQDHRSAEYTQLFEELMDSLVTPAYLASIRLYGQGKIDCLSYVTKKKEGVKISMTDFGKVERSEEYFKLVKELKDSLSPPINIALKIHEQGKKDGLSNDIIRQDIERAIEVFDKRLRSDGTKKS